MTTSSKFFSQTVEIESITAIKLADLMRTAGYGFEKGDDGVISDTPSLDSFIGSQCFFVPQTDTVYVGWDQFVCSNFVEGPPQLYKGFPALANESFNLTEFMRGIVDAENVWLYTDTTQELAISFVAT